MDARDILTEMIKKVDKDNSLSHEEKANKLEELKDADSWFSKGVNSYASGQLADSLDYYRQAIIIEPNHLPCMYNMAVIFD